MTQKARFLIFILGTAAMMACMLITDQALKTSATPHGIIALEFAYNTQRVNAVLQAWETNTQGDGISMAKLNTYLDFIFLFFYAGLLFNICRFIYHKALNAYGRLGYFMAKMAVLAALLDIIENIFMLTVLHHPVQETALLFMSSASLLKWLTVIFVIIYSLWGLLLLAKNRIPKS